MLTPDLLRSHFDAALPYERYVATAKPAELENWRKAEARVALTGAQAALVRGFTRRMPVLVTSGTWCGDCVQQCPMLHRIAQANPERIDLRFVDRDEHAALADAVKICGGRRVPTALFLNEDLEFIGLLGDRTLSRYRAMAGRQLGPACPLPGAEVPADELAATVQDWVDEFERVHLILRLSAKLRQRHQD